MLHRIAKTKAPFMKGQFGILFCTQSLAQYLAHSYFTNKYTEIKAIRHKLPNLFFLHQNIHMVTLFASSLSEILPSLAKINSYIYLLWCHNFWLHLDLVSALINHSISLILVPFLNFKHAQRFLLSWKIFHLVPLFPLDSTLFFSFLSMPHFKSM